MEKTLSDVLDALLKDADLTKVTAESRGDFEELPQGYYLCEVEKAELKESKSSKSPMAAFTFKVVEDGHLLSVTTNGDTELTDIPHTKNRKIFIYYPFKDKASIQRFASDMLKFEGNTEGVPLLAKECFTKTELIEDALDVLIGMRVYVQITVNEKEDGTKTTWQNLLSWKRARGFGLE